MPTFQSQDPNFEARVRTSFARQHLMATIGAKLTRVSPGEIQIELPFRDDLTQQHGFLHGGLVAAIMDSTCGYAALSLSPPDAAVLTVEYKVNHLSPARGEQVIARGRVTKPGRTVTVCASDAFAVTGGTEKAVATMLATIMAVRDHADLPSGM